MRKYSPQKIEKKWQQRWEKHPSYRVSQGGGKFYGLVEFPYPSGSGLHLGHAFTATIMDVLARQRRMQGFDVLYPMGWDAFGLPTENYAIKTGIQPALATKKNVARFREQMQRLGLAYNWEREVNTADPAYYHWTQWIFLQLFKHGLAYKQKMPINWCPSCKIGLANEEVVDGGCERCGAGVKQKELSQWLLRITQYADRLADELDLVDFPEYVKAAQRHWIGRKEWIDISYPIAGTKKEIICSTTRPETNFGATFIVLAPEHPVVAALLAANSSDPGSKSSDDPGSSLGGDKLKEIKEYVEKAKAKSELERIAENRQKTGVFTGLDAINQLNGRRLAIYIADFVLMSVGTGAVVGVPAHDQRDFEFSQQFQLPVVQVIEQERMINSQFLNGLEIQPAIKKIMDYLEKKGWGKRVVRYHLRDWIFSRQHYWGEPIPMVFCQHCAQKGLTWWKTKEGKAFLNSNLEARNSKQIQNSNFQNSKRFDHFNFGDSCLFRISDFGFRISKELAGWFPLAETDLPLALPEVEKYQPTGTGESPLSAVKNWVKTKCPHCQGWAQRETDTMPNWAGSSWYYLAYAFKHRLGIKNLKFKIQNKGNIFIENKKALDYWLPVDVYLGGAEHTTLHLLYSRFWHKFLNDIGLVPGKEPYARRRQHGNILAEDASRMSKSRGNVIGPEMMVKKYGADTLRLYLLFMGPYDQTMPWSSRGIEGCHRFLKRVWQLYQAAASDQVGGVNRQDASLHQLVKKVTEDIQQLKYNTAIAAMMKYIKQFSIFNFQFSIREKEIFLKLLAPFAPFIAEEIWSEILGKNGSVHQQKWPEYQAKLAVKEMRTIIVQINGKMRNRMTVKRGQGTVQKNLEKLALKDEKIKRYLADQKIKKTVFVPNRLINFVTD